MEKVPRIGKTPCVVATFALLIAGVTAVRAVSPPAASATISATQLGPSSFQYTLTLSDAAASPSSIGTFWYAWVPGKDFLTTSPTSIGNPAGWRDSITGGGGSDGYAVQWVASSSASDDTAGNTLTGFSFISSDAPSSVFGNSSFYPTFPTSTSVAYDAGIFSDAGTTFVATASTPEPASLAVVASAALLLGRRPRRSITVKLI